MPSINIFMSNIIIDSLPVEQLGSQGYLYADLHLDLKQGILLNDQLHKTSQISDIVTDFDLNAVRNSLVTLFTTSPGEKILNPQYGLNLRGYLFNPITEYTGEIIAADIIRNVSLFEPRVKLTDIDITADIESQQYTIIIQFDIPSLGITGVQLAGAINSSGFQFI